MTLKGFGLGVEATVTKLLWIGGMLGVMWLFGAVDLAISKLGELGATGLGLVVVFAVLFIWNVPRAAAAIQREADEEIDSLRRQLDDKEERQAAINALWQLRKEGVALRNERIPTDDFFAAWTGRVNDWNSRVLTRAEKANPNLRGYLETLDQLRQAPTLPSLGPEHTHQIRVMSEILQRLEAYLRRDLE